MTSLLMQMHSGPRSTEPTVEEIIVVAECNDRGQLVSDAGLTLRKALIRKAQGTRNGANSQRYRCRAGN